MAGILATSLTKTMVGGDTSADNSVTGYRTGEQIALSVTGSVTAWLWGQALPSGSSSARSSISSTTSGVPTFTPDVPGYYVVTCNADGTDYVIRIEVIAVATATTRSAIHMPPLADSQVDAPATGLTIYCGDDNTLRFKTPDDVVHTVLTDS